MPGRSGNRILLFGLYCILILSGCDAIRPFFIKNSKKEERKEKRTERKIERKEDKIVKKREKVDDLKSELSKVDSALLVKKDSLIIRQVDSIFANTLMNSRRINYQTYQCKAKIHFESEKNKQNFNINFRLKKDSVIWASITAPIIGEVVRAVITKDSVRAIERINKRCFLYSYRDIQRLINLEVEFQTLQELIIGNAVQRSGVITDSKQLGTLYNFVVKGADYSNQLSYSLADSSLSKLQLQTSRPSSTSSLMITMNNYSWIESRYFASQRQFNVLDIKGAMQLDMDISKAEFDKEMTFPFSIPKNYSRQD